ncbi:type II secretion system F family protein [Massilia sp. LXY-6]|uniref:type II secretion system F family protein n=1 Tax=Massilia sp. LXY-6 TaxID=3379823 RepID=UPI003EE0AB00
MLLPIVVFFAVTFGTIGAFLWLVPDKTDKRLHALSNRSDPDAMGWQTAVVNVVTPFAKLSTPSGDWESSPFRLKFIQAGIRQPRAPHVFFGLKTLLPFLLAVPVFFLLRGTQEISTVKLLTGVFCAAAIGCYLPNILLNFVVKRRKREIFDNFPDAADLMLVCVEAGLGLDAALTRVAEELLDKSATLAEELQLTNLEIRAGSTREKALRNLSLRSGVEELNSFATMLIQADKFGTSVGDSLRVFSEDLRHKRQVRAEEHAAKVPTKMLFPLVLFIFPSIIMVVLGPAIIQIVRHVGPMLSGQQ